MTIINKIALTGRRSVASPRRSLTCLTAFGCLVGVAQGAAAADLGQSDLSFTQLAQSNTAPVPGTAALISSRQLPPPLNPYADADQLKIRGWVISLPSALDTLDQGAFGLREALARDGISYLSLSSATFEDNLIRHGLPIGNSRDLQQYIGQLPTYSLVSTDYLMYDLRRFGIPDGQIVLGGTILSTNWNPFGPDGIILSTASYYQTLFNKKVEVKLGYLGNTFEYLGTYVGGSLASGVFGPSASIPIENGENSSAFGSLGANVKLHFPDNIYTKFGVQRAISPDSFITERLQNKSGVNFKVPNSGLLAIDEVGYQTTPASGRLSTWIRAAANYTSSRYVELLNPARRDSPNYGLYFLADQQLVQTAPHAGPGSAVQGLYAGFSAMDTPSYLNRFSRYLEARLYGFGLVPGRPRDLASLVATRNIFSRDAIRAARGNGMLAHDNVNALTFSYGLRVMHGITFNTGISYTDHPTAVTYTRNTGSALNVIENLYVVL